MYSCVYLLHFLSCPNSGHHTQFSFLQFHPHNNPVGLRHSDWHKVTQSTLWLSRDLNLGLHFPPWHTLYYVGSVLNEKVGWQIEGGGLPPLPPAWAGTAEFAGSVPELPFQNHCPLIICIGFDKELGIVAWLNVKNCWTQFIHSLKAWTGVLIISHEKQDLHTSSEWHWDSTCKTYSSETRWEEGNYASLGPSQPFYADAQFSGKLPVQRAIFLPSYLISSHP